MLRNYWYIACASSQLSVKPLATTILDERLVIYRGNDGIAHALEDRCCHRGVQLSVGKVVKGNLACGYHGWEYDGSGRCVHVPSLCAGTSIPAGFKVRSFPCVEQDHYIWAWLGDDQPDTLPSRIRGASEYAWKQGVVHAECNAQLFLENMLDAAHPPFAHKGTHPGYFFNAMNGFKEYEYEVRVTDHGYALFYPPAATAENDIPAAADSIAEFALPDRVTVLQKANETDFYSVMHLIPTGTATCRIEWMWRKRGNEPAIEWCVDEPKVIEQDRLLQESAQRNYAKSGKDFERSVPADFATLLTRKVIDLARQGKWDSDRHSLVQRKLLLVRQ